MIKRKIMSKEDKNKIEQIDQLIRLEATGNAKELGEKIGVCERTALYLIKKMKEEYNAPIISNSYSNSYIYTTPGRIILGFKRNIKVRRYE